MARTSVWLGRTLVTSAALFFTVATVGAQERYSVAGNAVAVYNLAGTVQVEHGTGDNVVVEVRRGGRDAERLQVDRRSVDGRSALIIRYPSGNVVYRGEGRSGSTTLRVRDDGTFYGDGRGGDRTTIRSRGSGTEAHADLRILVPAGRSLQVLLGVGSVAAANVEGDLSIDVGAAPVETSTTRGRLHIDTGSGSVAVRDAQGDVLVDTGSGSVALTNVRGRDVSVDTGSGKVEGSNVTADAILVDTGSGSVSMRGVSSRDVEIDTGSGRVALELLSDVDRLVLDTGSGSIRVAVPDDFGGMFEIDGSSVSIDVPASLRELERDHAEGTFGDGRGTIEIDTGSGRVEIVRR